jgi:hypothetical protein
VVLLNLALTGCPPSDDEARMVLLANRAYARSRNHEPATADIDTALELFARIAPTFVPLLILHAAVIRSLAGEHDAATQLALALALSPCPPIISQSAVRVAEHTAAGRVATGIDLPFVGRRGNNLVVVPTTEWHVGRQP